MHDIGQQELREQGIRDLWKSWARIVAASENELKTTKTKVVHLEEALRSIKVRCQEGDPAVNWIPTIERLASDALAEVNDGSPNAGEADRAC